MEEEFLQIAYHYYPKGINFLSENRDINPFYIQSKEFLKLNKAREEYFSRGKNYGSELIELLKRKTLRQFKDVSRIVSGDRSFLVQNSDCYSTETLKYHPFCIAYSGLIPYFYCYVLDIDIKINTTNNLGRYKWVKNNGILKNWKNSTDFSYLYHQVNTIIIDNFGINPFPDYLINEVIPDICNNNVEFGDFTFFNAFFLDDYFCLP